MPKSAKKSAHPTLIPRPDGRGALLSGGVPGNAGGSGRPPKEFKSFLAMLRKDPDAQAALERAAKKEESRSFGTAWGVITDYDETKPGAKVHLSGADGGPIQLWHFGGKKVQF